MEWELKESCFVMAGMVVYAIRDSSGKSFHMENGIFECN